MSKTKTFIAFHNASTKAIDIKNIIKIESNELKETDTKNWTCFYFNDIIKIEDFDFDNVLINEKLCKNILVYDILYKTFFDSKPLRFIFDKEDGFIRVFNGTRYLTILWS